MKNELKDYENEIVDGETGVGEKKFALLNCCNCSEISCFEVVQKNRKLGLMVQL